MNTHSIYFLLLAAVPNVLAFDQEDRATAAEAGGQLSQPDDRRAAPSFIWLESESAKSSFKAEVGDWGRPQFLSGGKWLHLSVDEGQVEKTVPDEGILLDYAFQSPKAGRYEVWNRVGFEFVRSPFEWRLDEGPWQKASPEALTVDLMEMGFWTEVAWLKMGEADVTAGEHDLQIRLPKTKNDKGQWQKVLYASDAICLREGPFQPNSKFKPGESGRDSADQAAAKAVFQVPEAKPSERASVNLGGVWEIARDDEQMPGEVAEPIHDLPKHPIWRAISVPGDKNTLRPDLLFAHRIWYRTRVAVPASMAGRAFYLDFPYNNLNTTIYVNGVYCGFEKNPFAPFQVDVTKGIKAGQTNEVWVGIRDAWYGRSADPERPLKLRKTFNYPFGLFSQGFQDMDYPVWNCPQSGMLATPALVAAGSGVYAADIFVKPSVAQQRLEAEAALNKPRAPKLPVKFAGKRWTTLPAGATRLQAAAVQGRGGSDANCAALRCVDGLPAVVAGYAPSLPPAHDRGWSTAPPRMSKKRFLAFANGAGKGASSRSMEWFGISGPISLAKSVPRGHGWRLTSAPTNAPRA